MIVAIDINMVNIEKLFSKFYGGKDEFLIFSRIEACIINAKTNKAKRKLFQTALTIQDEFSTYRAIK